jgi:uncharacterized protein
MRKVVLLLALLGLPGWAESYAQVPLPPAPTKYVTDAADVIPDDREQALNERLAEFERTTTHQVIVYVDRNIPEGTTLEEMGAEAIRTWAVGQEKRDNGAILFLFIDSRDSRIEAGYGLEGTLTDATSKGILVAMRPLLRDGDYAGAIEQGAGEIIRTITPEPPAAEPRRSANTPQELAPLPESSLFDQVIGFFAVFLMVVFGGGLLIVLFRALMNADWSTTPSGSSNWTRDDASSDSTSSWSPSSSSSSWGSSDSSSSSSSSGASSSSGFSGGGGSGGGGGASDKW